MWNTHFRRERLAGRKRRSSLQCVLANRRQVHVSLPTEQLLIDRTCSVYKSTVPRETGNRSVAVVLFSVGLLVAATNLQTSVLSLRAGLEGFREETIGLMMSAYFLGFTGGPILALRFVGSVGYIRTFAAFASVASGVALLHGLVISAALWALFRFVYGLCYAGLVLVVESWLTQEIRPESRGRALSIYGLVFMLGAGVGQLALTSASVDGLALFAVVSVVLSLSLVPPSLVRIEEPPVPGYARFRIMVVFRHSPVGASAVIAAGLIVSVYWSLMPRALQLLGLGTRWIAVTMSAGVLGALVLQVPLGRLSDLLDRRVVILWAAALGAASAAILATPPVSGEHGVTVLWLLVGILGGFTLPLYSLALAHINDRLPREDLAPAAATNILLFGLASAAGPTMASVMLRIMGPSAVFAYIAVVLVLFILFATARLQRRPALRHPAKRLFQALPRTTFLATRLIQHRHAERYHHKSPHEE